ncbi:carbohydrate kinase family protein [Streptococcus uberis]|uniref:carbohydrate kinase family protein n=1 Tax=Streptococcus uberis TaxID=1349 RepID=UPI00248D070D|nr:carbohydrate kinase family protein [Streptococcus uberis]
MKNESHFKILILSEVIPILKEKEQALLESSRQHPTNSQKEISEQVGISRLSVTDMTLEFNRRDYTLAKENTINNDMPVICIGGMNVDRKFYAKKELIMRTSNPVSSSVSIGGVGRNIAENLGRLGENVVMLSRVGDDPDWYLIKSASEFYMNLQHVEVCQDQETSTYIAIIDSDGDMSMALANMAICDSMTVSWLEQYETLLSRSKGLVVDLNLPQESLFYLIQLARKENLGLAIIPVSVPKMFNLPKNLTGVEWLIVNQNESEFFF